MASCNPMVAHVANMMKDIGQRLYKVTHKMTSRRYPYPVIRHTNIRIYRHICPVTEDALFVAPNALVQGNVVLGHNVSVMYHATLRNFHCVNPVRIGDNTTIMDRVSFLGQVRVGHDCVIGVGATLDCCDVHDNVYIGHGACVQLGCNIEDGAIIAAGAVVSKDVRVGAGELWAGNPAKKVATVSEEQAAEVQHRVHDSIEAAKEHKEAIELLYKENEHLDHDWLMRVCDQIEKRTMAVGLAPDVRVPIEAKRFMEPRVAMRRMDMHMRVSYPVNRIAPWMAKCPDWAMNV